MCSGAANRGNGTIPLACVKQPDGRPYPKPREQVRDHLTGPVLTALGGWDPAVVGPWWFGPGQSFDWKPPKFLS